jgi:hypothetical protein
MDGSDRPVSPLPDRVIRLVESWRIFWSLADAQFYNTILRDVD